MKSQNASPQRRVANQPEFGFVPNHFSRLVDPYDQAAPVEDRVRSYLHSNCAHCHLWAGGGNSKLDLTYWASREETKLIDELPVHTAFGLKDPRVVATGKPESSVLLHRMSIRGRGQMPQLATTQVDKPAVEMLTEWIKQMEAKDVPAK